MGEIYLAVIDICDTCQCERHICPRIADSAIGEFDRHILNGNDLSIKDVALSCRNDNGLIDQCFEYG